MAKLANALYILVALVAAAHGACPSKKSEVTALVSFKKGITRDPYSCLKGWTLVNSKWSGVTCDFNGRIKVMSLRSCNMVGTLSSSLGNLTSLQYLHLDHNLLTGFIPSTLGKLKSLQYLGLDYNKLTGFIPSTLGNLKSLQYLYLNNNYLKGSIPSTLGNLRNLQDLWLSYNKLTSSIPSTLGNLQNLQYLWLSHNKLTSSIPSTLGNLTSLQYLGLSINQLTGSIPSTLGNLHMLKQLVLNHNQLTGSIPSTIHNLRLREIYVNGNYLRGIPFCLNRGYDLSDNCFLPSKSSCKLGTQKTIAVCSLFYTRHVHKSPPTTKKSPSPL